MAPCRMGREWFFFKLVYTPVSLLSASLLAAGSSHLIGKSLHRAGDWTRHTNSHAWGGGGCAWAYGPKPMAQIPSCRRHELTHLHWEPYK